MTVWICYQERVTRMLPLTELSWPPPTFLLHSNLTKPFEVSVKISHTHFFTPTQTSHTNPTEPKPQTDKEVTNYQTLNRFWNLLWVFKLFLLWAYPSGYGAGLLIRCALHAWVQILPPTFLWTVFQNICLCLVFLSHLLQLIVICLSSFMLWYRSVRWIDQQEGNIPRIQKQILKPIHHLLFAMCIGCWFNVLKF